MTVVLEPEDVTAEGYDAVSFLADRLVAAGRFVPGLTVGQDGRARSWWWPMPAADDRAAMRALLTGPAVQAHRELADTLADCVDARVRRHLTGAAALPRRPGRRTLPELWILSLADEDPWLPESVDPARARALAAAVTDWVLSGRVAVGRLGLCLRVHEPPEGLTGVGDVWRVEVLVTDQTDVGLRIPMDQWWPNAGAYGASAVRGLLADLARATRIAPELARLLDEAVPGDVDLDEAAVASLLSHRVEPLTELGVTVLLPAWWTGRRRVGLRAKAKTRSAGAESAVTASGFGLDELVEFEWQAALGDLTLTKQDLKELSAAAAARRSLVRVRGQWVEVRPSDLRAVLARVGRRETASAGQLLRTGLGIESFDVADDLEVHGVSATGWLGDLLDQALHSRIRPIARPLGFVGTLRPYQARGVGWLTFLGRLGLGACLADDMGLGKTAQLIGSLLADPGGGPTLVVCPVSVLGNWERELAHFAPGLRVIAHHGTERDQHGLQDRVLDADVVLTTYSLVHRDIEALESIDWARLVLDEAQQVKNSGTSQAKAVRRLRAARRVALTGTPVENRLAELWSIMNVVSPGLLGSSREFREQFAVPIERDQDEAATLRLQGITRPFLLRRLKSDKDIAPDLPDKVERTDRCPLTREQAVLYQAVVDELLESADRAEGIDRRGAVLAGLTKLKQLCNHPALLLGDGSGLSGRSGKLTRIEELVEEVIGSGERALAFTQYATWGHMLAPYLSAKFGTEVLWLQAASRGLVGMRWSRRSRARTDRRSC